VTSAFLTLEIIPVISTYWRQEQLLWQKLQPLDAGRLTRLKVASVMVGCGWALLGAVLISPIYVSLASGLLNLALLGAGLLIVGGTAAYIAHRPAARRLVWPPRGEVTA
ncbi:MAG TPA: hypothetical protein VIM73_11075, partial [Polyangiaceae bacterium]